MKLLEAKPEDNINQLDTVPDQNRGVKASTPRALAVVTREETLSYRKAPRSPTNTDGSELGGTDERAIEEEITGLRLSK